tara:strand:+ start:110 stop:433 length:324 start_codon:yes stop_codon:yes gene_type:complete
MARDEEKEIAPLSEEEEISRMAACGFTNTEMALALGYDVKAFKALAEEVDSKIWTAIQAGKLQSEFMLIDKQRQLAESGNITAAQTFLKIKEAKDVLAIKNRIWFGT